MKRVAKPTPPKDYLREIFEYREAAHLISGFPCTAGIVRRDGYVSWVARERGHSFLGTANSPLGYMMTTVLGYEGRFQLHRLVWAYHNDDPGELTLVDHINGRPWDNRLSNLRLTDDSGNQRNRRASRRDSTSSKYIGVCRSGRKWNAFIAEGGGPVYLGRFDEEREAALARDVAAIGRGYEAANLNSVLFAEDFD